MKILFIYQEGFRIFYSPESAYVQNNQLDLNKETVLFCAAGGRSALAAKTLKEMGFNNVSHIEGGFGLMVQKGFKLKLSHKEIFFLHKKFLLTNK